MERARRVAPALVVGIGLILVLLALWQVSQPVADPPKIYSTRDIKALAKTFGGHSAPSAHKVPEVKPNLYVQVPEDVARRVNALIPFSGSPNIPARPFVLTAPPEEMAKARTCLAMAAYYEAGDDPVGQAAVVQVVVNRMRHPAFPKTICGVVLQGAQRNTGCQFTFACDGSLNRRQPSAAAFARAKGTAQWALSGGVFAMVGQATHYHTDYVLPSWSPEMDKIVGLHGHLFFRWRGRWGQPISFFGQHNGPEIIDARFAAYVDQPAMAEKIGGMIAAPGETGMSPPPADIARPTVIVPGRGQVELSGAEIRADDVRHIYYVYFGGSDYPGNYAVTAWKICAGKSPCTVYGWRSLSDIPLAVTAARPAKTVFQFIKDERDTQSSLWNCQEVQRDNAAQCLPGTYTATASPTAL